MIAADLAPSSKGTTKTSYQGTSPAVVGTKVQAQILGGGRTHAAICIRFRVGSGNGIGILSFSNESSRQAHAFEFDPIADLLPHRPVFRFLLQYSD